MFLSRLNLMITVYILALIAPSIVASLAISNPIIIPATLPHPTSLARTLAPRTTTCGTGYCPQGSTCCSNNTCCPSSTLCTRTPTNLVGCCPVGTVCDGVPAGYGEAIDGGNMLTTDQPQGQNEDGNSALEVESGNQNQTEASSSIVDTDAANNGNGTITNETGTTVDDSTGDIIATASAAETTTTVAATDTVPDVGAVTIIGAVAGGIIGWMALCAGLFWLHKKYRARHPKTKERVLTRPPAAGLGKIAFPQGFVRIEDSVSEVGVVAKAPRPYTTVYGPGARV